MKYKLFAIDLDKTTLNDKGEISDNNIKAIVSASKKGLLVVPTTGRTFYEIPEPIRQEKSIEYFIYSNGATIVDNKNNVLFKHHITNEDANSIFGVLSLYETAIEVYYEGNPYIEKQNNNKKMFEYFNIEKTFQDVMLATRVSVDSLELMLKSCSDVEMFNVFFKYPEEREECRKTLKVNFPHLNITTSMDNNLEILVSTVSKGSSIKQLCGDIKIKLCDVAAIGDSQNDIEMLEVCGLPIAVSNACDELKKIAQKFTLSNNENAINYAIKHILT